MIDSEKRPDEESCIIHCDECFDGRYKIGQKVVTIKNYSLLVLTITGVERIMSPGYPDLLLEGVDVNDHIWHAYSDNCIPYDGDIIKLPAQNNNPDDSK